MLFDPRELRAWLDAGAPDDPGAAERVREAMRKGGAAMSVSDPILFPMPAAPPDLAPPARRTAPQTTRDAARRIAGIAPTLRLQVLAAIREAGLCGLTDAEGVARLGLLAQTYTPRRRELAQLGAVVDSGRRRKTPSGRAAIVWTTPEHARGGEGVSDA